MNSPIAPNLARIPAGDFFMGAADANEDERPVHGVFVSEFFIGRFAVTHDEYLRFVRAAGHPPPAIRDLPLIARGDRESTFRELAMPYVWEDHQPPPGHGSHPVVLVRYDDALAYCRWLSDAIGRSVRLPTEAEWEKAARGGAEGLKHPWGNEIDGSRANYLTDPATKSQRGTRPTGTYPPNAYGLYDMCGNVWEWTADWFTPRHPDPAPSPCCAPRNPRVSDPASSYAIGQPGDHIPRRVIKGGSHLCAPNYCLRYRPAARQSEPIDTATSHLGFRCIIR
jgi:formylglycine-generating enzyme